MVFAARLVAFEPAGPRLSGALIDGVSWDASLPLNDVSALSLAYPDVVDPLGLGDSPVEIALQVSEGGDWVEPRNARFLSSEVQADLAAELDVPKYSFRGLGALLERPFILRPAENPGKPYTNDDEDPKRNFLSVSAGQIITSVLQESRSKYPTMLDGITLGFTVAKDSLGQTWDKLDSVAYSPGTDLLRILDDMVARGICDWWMQGRTLMVCNADKAAVKRDLRLNLLDVTESPLRATFENLASTVIVEGGQAKRWERPVSGATVPYGARVIRVANDSITTEGTALDLIARQALQATTPRREYTRTIATVDLAPCLDFECGDWVWAKTNGTAWEEVRVHELGLGFSQDDPTLTARVTLNDRFVDAAVRDAKRMAGITHGVTQNLGDGGIPSTSDKAIPAAPLGVAGNSVGYWQDLTALSSMDVGWQAVTSDVNGVALNGVDHYDIRVGGAQKSSTTLICGFDGLQPSQIYEVSVRAVSTTGVEGRWSTPIQVLTAYPLYLLDPPTAPSFRTDNGSVQTIWDGLLQGAGQPYAPPKHFSHVLVETRGNDEAEWYRWKRDQGWVLTGIQAGTVMVARLIAVDMLGRESDPGPQATVTVKSAAQEALDGLLVTQGDVQAAKDAAETAQQAAEQAQTDAGKAASEAAEAKEDAGKAQAAADKAKEDAAQAAQDAATKAQAAQDAAEEYARQQAEAERLAAIAAASDDAEAKAAAAQQAAIAAAAQDAATKAQAAQDAAEAKAATAQAAANAAAQAAHDAAAQAQAAQGTADQAKEDAKDAQEAAIQAAQDAAEAAEAALKAQTTADGLHDRLYREWGQAKPVTRVNGTPLKQGDELVTRKNGAAVQVEVWNGNNWTESYLLSGQIFILSTEGTISLGQGVVDTPNLKAGAIDSFQITSPLIQSVSTANRGIKWREGEIVVYDDSGQAGIRIDGANGLRGYQDGVLGVQVSPSIKNGLAVRSPAGGMVPLSDAAFGTHMVATEERLLYTVRSATTHPWTQFSADPNRITFVAWGHQAIIEWSQQWGINRGQFNTGQAFVMNRPRVNGAIIVTENAPGYASGKAQVYPAAASEDPALAQSYPAGTAVITTVPGQTYTVDLQFQWVIPGNVGGTGQTTPTALVNRWIKVTQLP